MKKIKVFISSVIEGYKDRRDAAEEAIIELNRDQGFNFEAIRMEPNKHPALNKSSQKACLDGIKECEIYLGIYSRDRYGKESPVGISPTHEEFREAVKFNRRRLVFVENTEKVDSRQSEFLKEVGEYVKGRFWNEFESGKTDQLKYMVYRALLTLMKEQKSDYPKGVEKITKIFPFRINKLEAEDFIKMNGAKTSKRDTELEVIRGELSSREHRTWIWGDAGIKSYKVDILTDDETHNLTWKTVQEGSQAVTNIIEIFPTLKAGERIRYTILEEFGPGTYLMTREEILRLIELNKWITDEPYLAKLCLVAYPTQELVLRAILPKEFPISGREFWDVKIGEGDTRDTNEYKRLRSEECFTTKIMGDFRVLELCVKNPKTGLSYWIKWRPPLRSEYEKSIHMS